MVAITTKLYLRVPCNRTEESRDNRTTAVMVLDGLVYEMCSRAAKDVHGQTRHMYGCPRTLYGSYTDRHG
ncbi:hypothetical protein DPMN_084761 [Dreissena polymorpha]|uniref:Uncharacterized protein n=1 Tax=Dreissena polymorpha TaxID=45954 RepID=A0A9D4BJP7_DREPO|nr:hypothetical protein DPMN_084761 [Dreissena polymorpha]